MFSSKVLGLKVKMLGTIWVVKNWLEKPIYRVSGQTVVNRFGCLSGGHVATRNRRS